MPNTEQGPKPTPPKLPLLAELAVQHDDHEKAIKALADAQEELDGLKDARREERIGWIVVCVILFNCIFLLNAQNWAGPLVVGILEIGILAVAAKRMGVQEFYALFANVLDRFGKMALGGKD